jgi:rhomboid protease GluP
MSDAVAEIFRSPRRAVVDERAFVLSAVGIAHLMVADGDQFSLQVDPADATRALVHLAQYEREIELRAAAPPPPKLRLHPHAWAGSVIYAAVLIGVAYAISSGLWRLDAFDAGELDATRVQAGQWWRAWTALTLHLDGAHLAANTAAGIWFGYLASRLMGPGNAWFLVVMGAGCANWIEAHFGPATHRAVGASTAVFTALGLLSSYSWRTRFRLPQRWASRWGPLVAGLVLLSWTGSGGQGMDGQEASGPVIDVVAHALGFGVGVLLGAAVAVESLDQLLDRLPQWLTGLLALVPVGLCWGLALTS